MENGGNAKVNAIFEANLASSGRPKPTNLADGPTRERFIRDKYERRKFFDPSAYSMAGNSGGAAVRASKSATGAAPSPGAPSEIARQRAARHQAKMKTYQPKIQTQTAQNYKPKVAQAPASAPVVLDLLDFGSVETTPATVAPTSDPFAAPSVTSGMPTVTSKPSEPVVSMQPPPPPPTSESKEEPQTKSSTFVPGHEFATPAPASAQPAPSSNASIMALFNTPSSNSGFGMQQGMGGTMTTNNMGMMANVMPQQQQQAMMGGMMNQSSQQQQKPMMNGSMMGNTQVNPQMMTMMKNNMQQQSQPSQQPMVNGSMVNGSMMGSGQMNQQMMAMMNNNMQQQFMMQNQMPYQMQQQGMAFNMNNGYNSQMSQNNTSGNANAFGNNNLNSMTQGFQQMNFGGVPNVSSQNQSAEDGGFGSPMGGNTSGASASLSNDPFSSLGGMNAFR